MKPQTIQDVEAALDGYRDVSPIASSLGPSGVRRLDAVTLHRVGQEATTVYEVSVGRERLKLTTNLSEAIRLYVVGA